MSKQYRLKKNISSPLGCADAGTISVEESEFYCFPYKDKEPKPGEMWTNSFRIAKSAINDFRDEWVEEVKPERIKVKYYSIEQMIMTDGTYKNSFFLSQPIPEDKFPAIKKAIEFVLNNEQ